MKQKDIALIIIISVVAGVVSFFVSKTLFVTKSNRQQKVEVAPAISTSFTALNNQYFNVNSVDPTLTIQIGNSTNPAPFSSGQ